jgi:hypothetical protein
VESRNASYLFAGNEGDQILYGSTFGIVGGLIVVGGIIVLIRMYDQNAQKKKDGKLLSV